MEPARDSIGISPSGTGIDGLPSKDVIGTSPLDGDVSAPTSFVSAPVVALTTAPPVFFAKNANAAAFAASPLRNQAYLIAHQL